MNAILHAEDLTLRKGGHPLTFTTGAGLTRIVVDRESGASTLSMVLAGRVRPASGTITLGPLGPLGHGATSTRARFRCVALAGVPLIDSLERSVAAREIIREQVAWAQPFYRRVPRDILSHRLVSPWLEPLGLAQLDDSMPVGRLATLDRLRLRVLLALIARPDAALLIVDDPDQLRNTRLRDELLASLKDVSVHVPVVVTTVNPDTHGITDHVVDLTSKVVA